MADINHVISLGIGSPAGIPEFLTFGLQIGAAVVVAGVPSCRTYSIAEDVRVLSILADARTFEIPEAVRTLSVECDT